MLQHAMLEKLRLWDGVYIVITFAISKPTNFATGTVSKLLY